MNGLPPAEPAVRAGTMLTPTQVARQTIQAKPGVSRHNQ